MEGTVEESPEPADGSSRRALVLLVLEAAGDADTAETLYGSVVEWSQTPRPRRVRELLFVVLAPAPGRRRCWAWRGWRQPRGDDAAANNLHARAAAMAARDRASPRHAAGAAAAT
jgi:hypothetical protein